MEKICEDFENKLTRIKKKVNNSKKKKQLQSTAAKGYIQQKRNIISKLDHRSCIDFMHEFMDIFDESTPSDFLKINKLFKFNMRKFLTLTDPKKLINQYNDTRMEIRIDLPRWGGISE